MGKGKGKTNYSNGITLKQRPALQSKVVIPPTTEYDRKPEQENNYQDASRSKVKSEESILDKLTPYFGLLASIITCIVFVAGIIFWGIKLELNLDVAKNDILNNERNIEAVERDLTVLNTSTELVKKDIDYLQRNDKRINTELTSLEDSINSFRFSQNNINEEKSMTRKKP
jgi:septal ring factor EnvC (AmiA/AmiB activator)